MKASQKDQGMKLIKDEESAKSEKLMRNVLFYKYVPILDLEDFQKKHLDFCKSIGILGKVLIASEGINGCITGSIEATEKYIQELKKDSRFSDIEFKIGKTGKHNFKKIFVRIRKEVVNSKLPVDIDDKAKYIEPADFKKLLESKEEFYVIDARNDYESALGKFENAITPDIKTFKEWPKAVEELKHLKDKKIVTYCTGGIRCEKASAYLKEQGFKDVSQLHGGIIRYGAECGNEHWEGKCFVFDSRGAIDIDPEHEQEPITQCVLCRLPCDTLHNCDYSACDKRFVCCKGCLEKLEHCCSKQCKNMVHQKQASRSENSNSPGKSCGYCS